MSKIGASRNTISLVPPELGTGFTPETEDLMDAVRMARAVKAGISHAIFTPYARVSGPNVIKRTCVCRAQRTHVDMAQARGKIVDDHPSVSWLLDMRA